MRRPIARIAAPTVASRFKSPQPVSGGRCRCAAACPEAQVVHREEGQIETEEDEPECESCQAILDIIRPVIVGHQ